MSDTSVSDPPLMGLEAARAFDQASHEALMAVVERLKRTGHLPEHSQRTLYTAEPDLHILTSGEELGPSYADQERTLPFRRARALLRGLLEQGRHRR